MVVETPAFKKAVDDSYNFAKKPSNQQKLKMYGLFKIAKGGTIAAERPKDGWFGEEGYKFDAWAAENKDTKTPADAQKKYVELIAEMSKELGQKPRS